MQQENIYDRLTTNKSMPIVLIKRRVSSPDVGLWHKAQNCPLAQVQPGKKKEINVLKKAVEEESIYVTRQVIISVSNIFASVGLRKTFIF